MHTFAKHYDKTISKENELVNRVLNYKNQVKCFYRKKLYICSVLSCSLHNIYIDIYLIKIGKQFVFTAFKFSCPLFSFSISANLCGNLVANWNLQTNRDLPVS